MMRAVSSAGKKQRMSGIPNWRLGCQAYTFRHFSFTETIDKNASLDLKCIEAYPGQALSLDKPDVAFGHNAPEEALDAVKAKLDSAGVHLVNYGVVPLPNDEAECRKVFDFAKAMGIETIVSEPPLVALELVDALCQEYGIDMAIHNHPAPSIYWNPDTVVKACEGRSTHIGACADTGHWVRSGVDPLEALKKLEGRIITLHIKDVDRQAPDAVDVPWGEGVGIMRKLLEEVWRQGIEPVFSIEYEKHSEDDPLPEVTKCVEFYQQVCTELAQASTGLKG